MAVCAVLTDSKDALTARKYWNKLKQRLKEEGNETVTNCHQLKLKAADGKMRLTDVADTEQLFRIIQSIPSPKAEPFKQWMASVASQRMDQMQDPELSIDQAIIDYKRLGYSDAWINQRIKSIEVRKELTDEWKRTGVKEGLEYASLTDIITREWSGFVIGNKNRVCQNWYTTENSYVSIYTCTLNLISRLICCMLSNFLYTLNVHFIYTKRTLTVHFSGDGCGFSVGKW